MNAQASHFVLDYSRSDVPFSNDAEVVGRSPDATSVVCRRDGAIREVDDLVSIAEVADDLSLPGDNSHSLCLLLRRVIGKHRSLFSELLVLHYRLLNVAIGEDLDDKALLVSERQ